MSIRTIAPKIAMPSHLDLVHSNIYTLKNGLKVHYFSGCSEPVLNLSIFNKAGKYYQNKDWVAFFTMALLKKGTKNFTAAELVEKIDFLGASLYTESNMFKNSISLSCLTDNLETLLPIIVDILTESNFPEEELALEKNKQIQKLKINKKKNEYVASVLFSEAVFGKNHPCGKLVTEEQINEVSREDILLHYTNRVKLDKDSIIILSGEINEDTLQQIDESIGKMELQGKEDFPFRTFEPEIEREIVFPIEKSVQASLRIGMPLTIDHNHPDYLDLEILNRILGGYFGSRLMKNIREEKGYTYGVYSFISNFEIGSYFCVATDVGLEYKENTVREIYNEINRLKTEPITIEELEMVKNYHKGRIMKSIDGSMRMANVLSLLLPLGLDEEHINRRLAAVENITPERIMYLANKYLDIDQMYKIIVG